jgi:large subunit ribosomal protein L25
VHQIIEHIDLLVVKKGEKVHVEVPVLMVGEPFSGTIATLDNTTVRLEVEATNIPEHVEVNVDGLEDGTHVTAAELTLPKGATLLDEPDLLFVAVSIPTVAAEPEEEAAEGAEASEAAEQPAEAPAEASAE